MDETIDVIFKVQFDFALEVWFSIYISGIPKHILNFINPQKNPILYLDFTRPP